MRNYWFPGVMKSVRRYVDEYNLCQRMKNHMETLVKKLMINEVLEKL